MFPKLELPRWLLFLGIFSAVAGLIPFGLVARYRMISSEVPRIHIIQDMDNQGRYKAQQVNALFADNRASRKPIAGTIPRGWLRDDDHLYRGLSGAGYATEFPMAITNELMQRGQRQYEIYCAPCHGLSGYGDGIVSARADALAALGQSAWVPPASLHDAPYNERELGHYFNTITNGIRNMPGYGSMLTPEDRWAVVSYVKALQLSQRASVDMVPAAERASIGRGN